MKSLRIMTLAGLLAIGALFLVIGFTLDQVGSVGEEGMIPVEGRILSMTDGTLMEYSVNGKTYYGYATTYSSFFKLGETYRLMVDPDNPERISGPALDVVTGICTFLGMLLVTAGVASYLLITRHIRRVQQLFASGLSRQGVVTAVTRPTPVGKERFHHTLNIEADCVHPVTGETVSLLRLISKRLCFFRVGDPIEVIFDPDNAKRYVYAIEKDKYM